MTVQWVQGQTYRVIYDFTDSSTELFSFVGLTRANLGNLYGTTFSSTNGGGSKDAAARFILFTRTPRPTVLRFNHGMRPNRSLGFSSSMDIRRSCQSCSGTDRKIFTISGENCFPASLSISRLAEAIECAAR